MLKMKNKILIVIGIIGFGLVMLILFIPKQQEKQEELREIKEEVILNSHLDCLNLTLENTSNCLRDYVGTFYFYKIRADNTKTEEDIKLNGGDCTDYSRLYFKYAKELGFNSKLVNINSNEKESHYLTIISDTSGYCVLDLQEGVFCIKW